MSLTAGMATDLLLLLLAANGSPILAKRLLGDRFTRPVDGGLLFFDGRPLLGASKTWRGVVAGVGVTALLAVLLGYPVFVGACFGLASLSGDALSSFAKRRFNVPPSGQAFGLDQIPEAFLPLWVLRDTLEIDLIAISVVVGLFVVGELLLSRVMYAIGVRDRPY
ncbi:MAG: CDP-archaeol synthase [Pseudomonadales bacterium]|nr:CDP-archaeol synthase [Pseudomonadales bacterium]